MKVYKSKASLLPGTSYDEILANARREFKKISKIAPRRHAYVRSKYFAKSKIFISPLFWNHLMEKHRKDRTIRLKFYKAAIDLLRNSRCAPHTIFRDGDYLHRFYGVTKDGTGYCVQVKQNKRSGRLDFMSVFDKKSTKNKKPPAL